MGVLQAFRKQKEENEKYGLVLVVHKEVLDGCKDTKKKNSRAKARENISSREYERGFVHGKAFDPHERMVKRKDL